MDGQSIMCFSHSPFLPLIYSLHQELEKGSTRDSSTWSPSVVSNHYAELGFCDLFARTCLALELEDLDMTVLDGG